MTNIEDPLPNWPTPDPSWDYAGIWDSAWEAKVSIEALIQEMGKHEEAMPETDKAIKDQLEKLQTLIEGAIALIPKH